MELKFAKYSKDAKVDVVFQEYANGQNAIMLFMHGMPYCKASVSLPDQCQQEDEVFIKNWGENMGLMEDLIANGYISAPTQYIPTGFAEATRHLILRKV